MRRKVWLGSMSKVRTAFNNSIYEAGTPLIIAEVDRIGALVPSFPRIKFNDMNTVSGCGAACKRDPVSGVIGV